MKRNPNSPWNPNNSCKITPKEYEKQVIEWLKSVSPNVTSFKINHLKHLSGSGGDYEFDGVVEFSIFNGAKIIVLIECKRYSRPVEREKILSLNSKMQDVAANKALIFSTSGFQSGALTYAKDRGIACVTFVEGKYLYETKDIYEHEPPQWIDIEKYAGIFIEKDDDKITSKTIDINNLKPLKEWLNDS